MAVRIPPDCPFFDVHDLRGYGKDYEWFLTGGCIRNDIRFAVMAFNVVGGVLTLLISVLCITYEVKKKGRMYFRQNSALIVMLSAACALFAVLYNLNMLLLHRMFYLTRISWIFVSELSFACQTVVAYTWLNITGPLVSDRLAEESAKIRRRLRTSLITGRVVAVAATILTCVLTTYYQAREDRDRSTIAWTSQLVVASCDCLFVGWKFWSHGGELVEGINHSCNELKERSGRSRGTKELREISLKMDQFRKFTVTNAISLLIMMSAAAMWGLITFNTEKGALYIGYFTLAFGPPVIVVQLGTVWMFGIQCIMRKSSSVAHAEESRMLGSCDQSGANTHLFASSLTQPELSLPKRTARYAEYKHTAVHMAHLENSRSGSSSHTQSHTYGHVSDVCSLGSNWTP
ncbi:hypothetical protein DFJ77DRAFT_456337 [Powellomyces hirtus]|nr:hypothetical protein DFJ77DRAFT_456337 [Powellomyces hirtus]